MMFVAMPPNDMVQNRQAKLIRQNTPRTTHLYGCLRYSGTSVAALSAAFFLISVVFMLFSPIEMPLSASPPLRAARREEADLLF